LPLQLTVQRSPVYKRSLVYERNRTINSESITVNYGATVHKQACRASVPTCARRLRHRHSLRLPTSR